ncbi:hypothetical protein QR680_015549 [Steinernema hermaphroditum]|uniref:Uncharacterized protein n=1 Tax=Steinernema hermaphroditum TaxID=289476 RepID=A0AA39H852_9BILA|nr:hypothetical protein QR680_015549 [Steinernema hermaphroditum]
MADLKSCWYPSRPNVTTAAVLIAVIDILAAILLILLNVANKIPDDRKTDNYIYSGVQIILSIVLIFGVYMETTGYVILSVYTSLIAVYAIFKVVALLLCAILPFIVLVIIGSEFYCVQAFMKKHHWFDPTLKAEEQETTGYVIWSVYTSLIAVYALFKVVALVVVQRCWAALGGVSRYCGLC